jgi:hypothetical protein
VSESAGAAQIAPRGNAPRRCSDACGGRHEKISTGLPSTSSTCMTSS